MFQIFYYEKSIIFYESVEEKFEDLNKDLDNRYISYANIFKNQSDISKIYYDFVHYNDYFYKCNFKKYHLIF